MMYLRTWLIATMFGLALVAVSLASKPAPAFGDTQWFGSYMGKTYLTEFDYYPVGYNWGLGGWIYGYCGGAVWGETYYGGSGSYSALWTDKYDLKNGTFQWLYQGYTYSSAPSTYVYKHNSRCSRGATDHYSNGSYVGTTSDGF